MIIDKEIKIVGLRRSGNHAIIHWIINQHQSDYIFENKIKPFDLPSMYKGEKKDKVSLSIYSYEDVHLSYVFSNCMKKVKERNNIQIKKQINVLILRNPFNLFASRVKSGKEGIGSISFSAQDLWIAYAKEFLGITHYMGKNKVVINYDLWFEDTEYRKGIAESMGLQFSDKGKESVPDFGGGSSFDNLTFNNRATEMKVNDRWKLLKGNRKYEKYLQDLRLLKLYTEIYPENADLSDYLSSIYHSCSVGVSYLKDLKYRILIPLIKFAKEFPIWLKLISKRRFKFQ